MEHNYYDWFLFLPIQGTPSSEPHSLPLISPQGTGTVTSLPFKPGKEIFNEPSFHQGQGASLAQQGLHLLWAVGLDASTA